MLKSVDYLIYHTHRNLDLLTKHYKGRKTLIPMGVDYDYWVKQDKNVNRKELELPEKRFIILWAGRLVGFKQFDKVIDVLIRLSQKHDFLFLVIGKGEIDYESYCKTKAEPLIEKDMVRFLGYQNRENIRRYYNSVDLLIRAATDEGGPVASMEALGCEVPIFSTDAGQVAEILQDEGYGAVVGRRDYDQWESVLGEILSGTRKCLPLPRNTAGFYFSWNPVADKYLKLYEELADLYKLS